MVFGEVFKYLPVVFVTTLHIGWNSAKIVSRMISVTLSLSAHLNMTNLFQLREHPQILAGIGVGRENCRFSTFKPPYL